jgi:hypothetical protein
VADARPPPSGRNVQTEMFVHGARKFGGEGQQHAGQPAQRCILVVPQCSRGLARIAGVAGGVGSWRPPQCDGWGTVAWRG